MIADSVTARMQADHYYRTDHPTVKTGRAADTLFKFDPNSIGKQGWMKLGLSSRQADAVLAYRKKSGGFRDKLELSRVKVISPQLLQRWDNLVVLPESSQAPATPRKTVVADVNVSDSAAFDRIRGIGPSLAGRIVRYRERLGGFTNKEQIREVYGVSDSLWQTLAPSLVVAADPFLRKLDLNTSGAESLKSHPYIGYKMAGQILNYRRQHLFKSVDELKRLPLVSEEIYRKLVPYLNAEK
jgi:DNA uptake protein ComE-like DNA-binding protein